MMNDCKRDFLTRTIRDYLIELGFSVPDFDSLSHFLDDSFYYCLDYTEISQYSAIELGFCYSIDDYISYDFSFIDGSCYVKVSVFNSDDEVSTTRFQLHKFDVNFLNDYFNSDFDE